MASDKRTTVHRIDVLPDRDRGLITDVDGKKVMNMWKGWKHKAIEADWPALTATYREFVRAFFESEPGLEELWWKWNAYWGQNPGKKSITGWVIVSPEQGVGKSLLAETIGRAVGKPAYASLGPADLNDEWSEWVENCLLAICNEPGDADYKHVKNLKTADTMRINIKYGRKYVVRNMLNLVVTTNELTPYRIDVGSRRDIIYRPPFSGRSEWTEWLAEVVEDMQSPEFYSALLWYLSNEIDLVDYSPIGEAPITSSASAIWDASMSPAMAVARDINDALRAAGCGDVAWLSNDRLEMFAAGRGVKSDALKKFIAHSWGWSKSWGVMVANVNKRGIALAKAEWCWTEANKAEVARRCLEVLKSI
jgi:hypothetical protein